MTSLGLAAEMYSGLGCPGFIQDGGQLFFEAGLMLSRRGEKFKFGDQTLAKRSGIKLINKPGNG